MKAIIRSEKRVKVDESDVISLARAAEMLDVAIPTVSGILDRGKLPWLEYDTPDVEGTRKQRFTRKSAVEAMIAARGKSKKEKEKS